MDWQAKAENVSTATADEMPSFTNVPLKEMLELMARYRTDH
jgi:hypothetical protein